MKTLRLFKVLVGVVSFIAISCSDNKSDLDIVSESIKVESTGETSKLNAFEDKNTKQHQLAGDASQNQRPNFDIKIVKNANCRLNVKKVEKVTRQTKKLVTMHGGYISDERFTQTNYTKENRFVIRIPNDKFDVVLDSLSDWAQFVDHKNISTQDVTEEYVDVSARLRTKLEVKERYETILRQRAKTVEEILEAEHKIKEIQEEIEAAKGRLQYLTNKVSFSTIQVDLYETVIPLEEPNSYTPNFGDKAKKGLLFGWMLIENFSLLLFYIWPFIIVGILVVVYFRWIRK